MNKSVKPLVCVLVVSDLMLATWIPGVNVNSMALSDSASSSIPKKGSKLNVYDGAVVYCYVSQIPCYFVNKLLKKRSTLTVVRDT